MAYTPPIGEVQLNEAEIERLISVYKKTYKQVLKELVTIKDFKIRTRKQKLRNIRELLTDLKVDVDKWVEKEVEIMYKAGQLDAVRELQAQGVDIADVGTFTRIDRQAVENLVSETQEAFLVGMTGVSRQSSVVLGKAYRDLITKRLLEGKVTGTIRKEIKNQIVNDLKENGLNALVDRSGREWTLDRYSQMIIRTKMTEARNRGLINKTASVGYDTVIVSVTGTKHYECAIWEDQVLSMTGATPDYPTLDEAMSGGLFHPNCQHSLSPFVPKLNPDYQPPEPPDEEQMRKEYKAQQKIQRAKAERKKKREASKVKVTIENLDD